MSMNNDEKIQLQYGCGLSAPDGWVNFDASPTLRLQKVPVLGSIVTRGRARFPKTVRYGDVLRRLPVADGSCRLVYCSHVLEHLSLNDFRRALRETYRILAGGGIFRGVLPDLEALARAYVDNSDPDAAMTFMRDSLLGIPDRPRGMRGVASATLGNSHHLWMWDYKALAQELANAGFRDIRRASFGDSGEAAFAQVEEENRWNGCLGFQCSR